MKTKILTIITLFILISCANLNLDPLDKLPDYDTWQTPKILKQKMNNFYTIFPEVSGWNLGYLGADKVTDNMLGHNRSSILTGNITQPTSGGFSGYKNIRKINYFIEQYKTKLDKDAQSDADYQKYLGEAHFFRAYVYFSAYKTYGNLPIIKKSLNVDDKELYNTQDNRSDVVDFMLEDLDLAINYLPNKKDAKGRVSKEFGYLLRSRIALYEGSWQKYHAGTEYVSGQPSKLGRTANDYFKEAKVSSEALIKLGTLSIPSNADSYRAIFSSNNLDNNTEIIFARHYNINLGVSHNLQRYIISNGSAVGITRDLVDSYLCIHGYKPWDCPTCKRAKDVVITEEFINRDLRLHYTVWHQGTKKIKKVVTDENGDTKDKMINKCLQCNDVIYTTTKKGETFNFSYLNDLDVFGNPEQYNVTGFQLRKGDQAHHYFPNSKYNSITATPVARYAEAILNYAEACVELGDGANTLAISTFNDLRTRAGVAKASKLTLEIVRNERRCEFACEGYRYDDLLRWNEMHNLKDKWENILDGANLSGITVTKGEKEMKLTGRFRYYWKPSVLSGWDNNSISEEAKEYKFGFDKTKNYLRPISSNELVLNPNLKQNPGW